ncbi:MAG: hemerythrin domain-containing protein [Candidatus Eremiobacteraeota bacterium]|nr:hemerythrin domain-containing protein [Candidatus Eremiobacteraeota bacterium]
MEKHAIVSDDVIELILDDHATFRRLFERIDQSANADDLRRLWFELGPLLEAHAAAEEASFYPALLKAAKDDDDVRDAIHDHNKIRDAVRDANLCDVSGDEWRAAVKRARDENDEHMSEEERGPLPAARKYIALEQRLAIGLEFLRLRSAYPSGKAGELDHDKDPDSYVKEHES